MATTIISMAMWYQLRISLLYNCVSIVTSHNLCSKAISNCFQRESLFEHLVMNREILEHLSTSEYYSWIIGLRGDP